MTVEALLCKQDSGGRYPSPLRHPEETQALEECSLPPTYIVMSSPQRDLKGCVVEKVVQLSESQ